MTPAEILSQYWGYDSFRECQAEIIDSVLKGNDTIGLLPTGGGKSVTFQVPALLLPGLTLVVTPLISLMKDQVDNLRRHDIRAGCLNSAMTRHETRVTLDRLELGKIKLLYVSPEKLCRPEFIALLTTYDISLIVVDEAHCISQWGYDFRPSYLKISELRKHLPGVPVLALTATATPAVVTDIADKLLMKRPAIFRRSFSRDNISYIVRRCEIKEEMLAHILRNTSGSAIVYVRSRRRTALIAQMLANQGIPAQFYHAGLAPEDKSDRQDEWMEGRVRVMVATNAFGMGIDKPDVRLVVHYDIPPSLEEYYQEAGRAGRDGLPAYAVLLASTPDKGVMKRRLGEEFPPRDYIRDIYQAMCVFLDVPMGEGYNHLYECDFAEFCRRNDLQPRPASAALSILTRSGVIEFSEEVGNRSRLMVVIDRRDFYDLDLSPDIDSVMQAVLRLYTGIFADFVPIDETRIAYTCSLPREEVYQALLALARMHVIQYVPARKLPFVYFPSAREESRHIVIPREVYEVQLERATRRMEAMRDYAFNDSDCRVNRMLAYFGDTPQEPCGKCDICRKAIASHRHEERERSMAKSIESLFASGDDITLETIKQVFPSRTDEAIDFLRTLIDKGILTFKGNRFILKKPYRPS